MCADLVLPEDDSGDESGEEDERPEQPDEEEEDRVDSPVCLLVSAIDHS